MNRIVRLQQELRELQDKAFSILQDELHNWMNDILKGSLNPAKLIELIQMMGIDMARFPGMIGEQAGFDPYKILGLDKSATDDEVKNRYRELTFKLHSDTAGVKGTDFLFQMVVAAYEIIKRERKWE